MDQRKKWLCVMRGRKDRTATAMLYLKYDFQQKHTLGGMSNV